MSPDDWLREHVGAPEEIDLGLERCKQVLSLCNLEVLPFQVFTIGGTNGKGSTVAILDSILSASGLLTGRYSSPHLIRFNERILVAQEEKNNQQIIAAFNFIKSKADGIALSYFEYATLASLVIFAQDGVDVALLEVGLGGRLDACNSVDADVSAITSIALDHQDWLGEDLNSIAHEKAGIMRSNKPCILASADLPESIASYAQSINAKTQQLNSDYSFYQEESQWVWNDAENELILSMPSLAGEIQLQNAAGAIAVLRHSHYWPLATKHLNHGLDNIKLSGRVQQLDCLDRHWILDVAHNPASMTVLCDFLKSQEKSNLACVFSMLSDKDARNCIAQLKPFIKNWFITELASPRGMSLNEIKNLLLDNEISTENIFSLRDIASACKDSQLRTSPKDTIVACGSFYTVGETLEFLESNQL